MPGLSGKNGIALHDIGICINVNIFCIILHSYNCLQSFVSYRLFGSVARLTVSSVPIRPFRSQRNFIQMPCLFHDCPELRLSYLWSGVMCQWTIFFIVTTHGDGEFGAGTIVRSDSIAERTCLVALRGNASCVCLGYGDSTRENYLSF